MPEDIKLAIEVVVSYLDEQMQKSPSKELANCCNYLQELIDGGEE